MKTPANLPFLLVATFALACSSSGGDGTVAVTAYGESFIEEGIPSSEVDDDWDIEFDRFEVDIEDVEIGGSSLTNIDPVDLTKSSLGKGHEVGRLRVSEGEHTHSSFTITHIEVEGRASKEEETKTFHWVFDHTTSYGECESTTSITDGERGTFQIAVHADHLFHDSLVSENPKLLFGPLSEADEDQDGEITEEELSHADIGSYDPGSEDGIDDLWSFLTAQSRTLGHVDGEGHCHAEAVD